MFQIDYHLEGGTAFNFQGPGGGTSFNFQGPAGGGALNFRCRFGKISGPPPAVNSGRSLRERHFYLCSGGVIFTPSEGKNISSASQKRNHFPICFMCFTVSPCSFTSVKGVSFSPLQRAQIIVSLHKIRIAIMITIPNTHGTGEIRHEI